MIMEKYMRAVNETGRGIWQLVLALYIDKQILALILGNRMIVLVIFCGLAMLVANFLECKDSTIVFFFGFLISWMVYLCYWV